MQCQKVAKAMDTKTIGTCLSMCPMKEIYLRERENMLHQFETHSTHTSLHPKADPAKCVKVFHRPTVGSQTSDPSELRPAHILLATVDYLIYNVAALRANWFDIYDFVFDRLRSVRQDLVIQEIEGFAAISILEKALRFHIFSDYRLSPQDISVYDPKINCQHTQECLKRLLNLYNETPQASRHRPEFEASYLLFNLGDDDALRHYYSLDKALRNTGVVRQAYKMSCAFKQNNWVQLFRRFKCLDNPIHLCAVHRHFHTIQSNALRAMSTAYSSKNLQVPISKLTELLFLNTDTDTQHFCEAHSVAIDGCNVQFMKNNFSLPDKLDRSHSDFIARRLKPLPIPALLSGPPDVGDPAFLCGQFHNQCRT